MKEWEEGEEKEEEEHLALELPLGHGRVLVEERRDQVRVDGHQEQGDQHLVGVRLRVKA